MIGLPSKRRAELERDLTLNLTPEDHALAGGFLHFCDEWDGLLIDRDDPEFEFCSCQFSDEFDPDTGKLRAA
jgi:hypothetical protein